MNTKTERLRRLRILAREVRVIEGVPSNAKVEVGSRNHPVKAGVLPAPWCHPEDDLRDMMSLVEAAEDSEVTNPGTFVHFYVCDTYGDLSGVYVGWMGWQSVEPQLVDGNGFPLYTQRTLSSVYTDG